MDSRILRWTGVACFACASAIVNASEFAYVEPMFKDLTPGVPGDELTITPQLGWVDNDGDDYPDKLRLAFNVWEAGSKTKLLQTDKITVNTPTLPCLAPTDIEEEVGIRLMGASSPNRVHMLVDIEVQCDDGVNFGLEAEKAIWYSANVETGSSYKRAWPGWGVFGSNSVDWDDDGNNELQLILENNTATGDTTKFRVIYMRFGGKVEADNTYNAEFFNY